MANSRLVRMAKIIDVIVAVGGLMLVRSSVSPPIQWINKWPAVMVVAKQTARTIVQMNKLMVWLVINIGMREIVVMRQKVG